MKNLSPFLLVILLALACTKNDNVILTESNNKSVVSKQELKNADLQSNINYINFHMDQLTYWVSEHTETILKQSIQERRFSKINEYPTIKIETLYREIEAASSKSNPQTSDLMTSLTAFEGVQDVDWYPIVYVYDNGNLNLESSTDRKVYIAVESADKNGEITKAYERTKDNKLIPIHEAFTEEFVGDNILIVVELDFKDHMSTDLIPREPEIFDDVPGPGGGGSGGTTPRPRKRTLKLDRMKIKDLKEGWPFRPEISIKGYKITNIIPNITYDCREYISISVNCDSYSGVRLSNLKRRYRNKMKSYNWTISNEPYDSDAIIYYVIYEYDFTPFTKVYRSSLPNGASLEIRYKSWNNEYHETKLTLKAGHPSGYPLAYGYSKNNSAVEYYLK